MLPDLAQLEKGVVQAEQAPCADVQTTHDYDTDDGAEEGKIRDTRLSDECSTERATSLHEAVKEEIAMKQRLQLQLKQNICQLEHLVEQHGALTRSLAQIKLQLWSLLQQRPTAALPSVSHKRARTASVSA